MGQGRSGILLVVVNPEAENPGDTPYESVDTDLPSIFPTLPKDLDPSVSVLSM